MPKQKESASGVGVTKDLNVHRTQLTDNAYNKLKYLKDVPNAHDRVAECSTVPGFGAESGEEVLKRMADSVGKLPLVIRPISSGREFSHDLEHDDHSRISIKGMDSVLTFFLGREAVRKYRRERLLLPENNNNQSDITLGNVYGDPRVSGAIRSAFDRWQSWTAYDKADLTMVHAIVMYSPAMENNGLTPAIKDPLYAGIMQAFDPDRLLFVSEDNERESMRVQVRYSAAAIDKIVADLMAGPTFGRGNTQERKATEHALRKKLEGVTFNTVHTICRAALTFYLYGIPYVNKGNQYCEPSKIGGRSVRAQRRHGTSKRDDEDDIEMEEEEAVGVDEGDVGRRSKSLAARSRRALGTPSLPTSSVWGWAQRKAAFLSTGSHRKRQFQICSAGVPRDIMNAVNSSLLVAAFSSKRRK